MVTQGAECILIDSAHKEEFKLVHKDIIKRGLTIKHLIITHYHPDHIGGIEFVDSVIGSAVASDTLGIFHDDYSHMLPDIPIDKETTIMFGNHKIALENNPSHSKCTLLITLDDKYLFVGDDIMTDNVGNLVMPYVAETVLNHVNGVERIASLSKGKVLLPSHGVILSNPNTIEYYITSVLTYLNYVIQDKTKSYFDFLHETNIELLNYGWHKSNITRE